MGRVDKNGVARKYARLASIYDRRWHLYLQATLQQTLQRLDLQPAERLLDVGCGTGVLLEAVCEAFPSVACAGVDLSAEMLGQARRKLGPRAALFAARAESLPFCSSSFDVVVSCNSFHYWQRPARGLAEIARVLRPAGRLVMTDWCGDYLACRLFDSLLRITTRTHSKIYRRRECKHLLEQIGFGCVYVERYRINWLWGLMTVKATPQAA